MRLRWFLALASVVLAVVGTTVVAYESFDGLTGAGDQVLEVPDGERSPDGTVDPVRTDPDPSGPGVAAEDDRGFLEVAGPVDVVHVEDALLEPATVPAPLTIESTGEAGGGAEVTGVVVGGAPSSIVWDGGRPFALTAGPGLRPTSVTVDLADGVVRCTLAEGAHRLAAGEHRLETPVAVGGGGIATPRDAVTFTAGPDARLVAGDGAALVLPPDGQHPFSGRGLVSLVGDLVVTTESGDQAAGSLDLRDGDYELTLSPTEGGGWTVSGRVRSRVVGDLVLGDR